MNSITINKPFAASFEDYHEINGFANMLSGLAGHKVNSYESKLTGFDVDRSYIGIFNTDRKLTEQEELALCEEAEILIRDDGSER